MKNTKKMKIAAVVTAVAIAASVTVFASYDSAKDPIVSLSYLTDIFKPEVKSELKTELKNELKTELKSELKAELEAEIKADLEAEIYNKLSEDYSATFDALQKQLDALSNEYEVVTLEKGQRLRANAACEFVILSGSASVKCATADEGLIDCTEGTILYDGQAIPQNHKILVPDNGDDRGFSAAGAVEILVKGGCTIG